MDSKRSAVPDSPDSDQDHFTYPQDPQGAKQLSDTEDDQDEPFRYPIVTPTASHPPPPPPAPAAAIGPEFEKIYAAASNGDLDLLQRLFRATVTSNSQSIDSFTLANEASSRTGLTLLHVASAKGHLDVVQWLATDSGTMVDIEDKEGETSLHKAALNGHLLVVQFLLSIPAPLGKADVHARDADGWTALHNACSKGYLDIVRYLCEQAAPSAADVVPHTRSAVRGVDLKSKGGWTPLMNAASKGHLPVVLYLLFKQHADPFVRNKWGETALDVASSVFEIWISEVLSKSEKSKFIQSALYNPLSIHTTVPILLYENQRLSRPRLNTLNSITLTITGASGSHVPGKKSGGVNPQNGKWTAHGLERRGVGAWEIVMPSGTGHTGPRRMKCWRSDVELPTRTAPFVMPLPRSTSTSTAGATTSQGGGGEEKSHFWLSDWTLDLSHPKVDVMDGWQYAHSFIAPDDDWVGAIPLPDPTEEQKPDQKDKRSHGWVRRRRWVRLLRRRLDIPPLPYLEPTGEYFTLTSDGTLIPYVSPDSPTQPTFARDGDDDDGEREMELTSVTTPGLGGDYVQRAKYLAGSPQPNQSSGEALAGAEVRRSIAKLERAVSELRSGILSDDQGDRKTQAEVLLNAYGRELERQRLDAGARGLLNADYYESSDSEDDDDDSSSFHYPSSSSARRASMESSDYFSQPYSSSPSRLKDTPTNDLSLSQAPDFRVPTHDAPQEVTTPRWRPPGPHELGRGAKWERDEDAVECRNCRRRFTFLFRKHCRKCGHIFCDKCTSFRSTLEPSDVVHDPSYPVPVHSAADASTLLRVCESCHKHINARESRPPTTAMMNRRASAMEAVLLDSSQLSVPSQRMGPRSSQDNLSMISDLADCPVCGQVLGDLGSCAQQEAHIKACLEGGSGSDAQTGRYLIYKLPSESPLIGSECVICLEEFMKGSTIARLSCFCSFHSTCLSAWLQRGRSCPVHAR